MIPARWLPIVGSCVLWALVACGSETSTLLPEGAKGSPAELRAQARPLSLVLAEPDGGDRVVTVSGTIGKVCRSMGCWFYVADAEQMVLVDLKPVGFTVPIDASGRPCVVEGRLYKDGSDRRIDARRVALWPAPQ